MEIKGNKFLITGGASQVGTHIAEQLVASGAKEVVLFDNFSLGSATSLDVLTKNPHITLVRGDILRPDQLMTAMQGVSGVFAVAGFLTLPLSKDVQLGVDVNVKGHANVLEACRWQGVKKVVLSSSVAVYGAAGPGTITEDRPLTGTGIQAPSLIYASSKLLDEGLCRFYGERYAVDYVALRYSTIYGPRQHYRGVNALYIIDTYDRIRQGLRPQLPGDGSEVHDYVYVEDVARANVMAMASDVSGEALNICTNVATSLNRIVDILLALCKKGLKPEYIDNGNAVRFLSTTELDYSRDKARRLIGWEPRIAIEDGIARLIQWSAQQQADQTEPAPRSA